jgi:hypothetical protein
MLVQRLVLHFQQLGIVKGFARGLERQRRVGVLREQLVVCRSRSLSSHCSNRNGPLALYALSILPAKEAQSQVYELISTYFVSKGYEILHGLYFHMPEIFWQLGSL